MSVALADLDRVVALLDALPAPGAPARPVDRTVPLIVQWVAVIDQAASDEERGLLVALAHLDLPVPVLGVEAEGGIPVDVSWPDLRVAAALSTLTASDVQDLTATGWRVAPPEAAALSELLQVPTGRGLRR